MSKIEFNVPDEKAQSFKEELAALLAKYNGKVDVKDNRPITERVKTFEDACKELGDEHPFVVNYKNMLSVATREEFMTDGWGADFVAYAKLRIIVAALNEGWEPQFTTDEYRYYPWFELLTQDDYNDLDEGEKGRCVLRSGHGANLYCGFVGVGAYYDASNSNGNGGSRLAFKTRDLARYAGTQFAEIYANFVFKPKAENEDSEKFNE